jgi:hypothetical protein
VIDFRYHLVSIVAVFLALAVGIVLGTTTLNGAVLDNLNGQVTGLRTDKQNLRTELRTTQDQVASDAAFVKLALPMLVAGRLDGQQVAVLSSPGTPDGLRKDVVAAVQQAGATLTVQLRISPDYVDPRKDATLASLVSGLGSSGRDVPSGNGARRAAVALASVLVAKPGDDAGSAQESAGVLRTFQQAGLIALDGGIAGRATLAVLLAGPGQKPASAAAEKSAMILLDLASALDSRSAGTVIGGPLTAATEDGLLSAARSADGVSQAVGTVDSVDSPVGQVETVLALVAQLRGDSVAWGAGPGTTAPELTRS